MPLSRRDLVKGAVAAGAAAAAGAAEARVKPEVLPDAVGMLFDATRCVGCRGCQSACKVANELPPDRVRAGGGEYDAPTDLNATTKNVVKLYAGAGKPVFVKQQCMHCLDPSCVSVCMMGALHKEGAGKRPIQGERKGSGIVLYDAYTCVGCRYCQIACPFNVPKFEWTEAFPLIVKCELCRKRRDPKAEPSSPYAIANPACAEVCPTGAVVYGRRAALLADARRRIADEPARYAAGVYGEREGGGTGVLYLAPAGVRFRELGLPALPDRSSADFSESVSHAPYAYGVTPVVLYAALAAVVYRNKRSEARAEDPEEGK